MKKSDLRKMVQEAIKRSLTEMDHSSHPDPDELAYADHVKDLETGVSDDHVGAVESLLMGICAKFKKNQSSLDPEVLAQAVHHLEQADALLGESDVVQEGIGYDRSQLVMQVQALGKKIATRAPFSAIPDGAMSVMASNLEAIVNKLS